MVVIQITKTHNRDEFTFNLPLLVINDKTFKAYKGFDKYDFESYDIVSSP
jgi:hypothetical protein